jgi:hypothetical protein
MGRGRAKAKQTKVARELKYSSPGMDLNRLSQDLHSDSFGSSPSRESEPAADDYVDPYAEDDDEDSAAS